ncbi:MAG: hypothetical protein RIQ68_1687 [Pseudomonadota bacterium]
MIKASSNLRLLLAAAAFAGGVGVAQADKIKHPTAVFAGLDKITGRIITFDVAMDETVQFGTIQITPRICYTRPPTEAPQTTSFVEVDEINAQSEMKRIFAGWMFAASPGLHAIEHPVYDAWLTDCRGGKDIIVTPPETADLRDATPPAERTPAQRQQPARPATPGPVPPLGNAIEVGAAPGSRVGTPAAPPPSNLPALPVIEAPSGAQPRTPAPAPQQAPQRLPTAREAPIALPPANIPSGR